ncbi:MAG: nucleotidyl transferase AbiEii/AbiGii toxin family protein [Patescibacteria group bacterium]|nr:nucleotidyl transferase AbiEii/AbiGii toxin family protein [Patescibacteria group bacterium]
MITPQQVANLAKQFQVDSVTIYREYIQLVFLNSLYQNKKSDKVCFKGGTAIRLLFGSPRFSEDLDFDTTYPKKEITSLIGEMERAMSREIPGVQIYHLYSGKNGIRFRIKLDPSDLKFPLIVRLDFTRVEEINATATVLKTDFPVIIFPLIYHACAQDILREKFLALAQRNKGRDLFDILYLLRIKTPLDPKSLDQKLLPKIEAYPQSELERDLRPFLPAAERRILPILKSLLVKELATS